MAGNSEHQLANRPFLLGGRITEPDPVLFASLVRYDAIYLPFNPTRIVPMVPKLSWHVPAQQATPGARA